MVLFGDVVMWWCGGVGDNGNSVSPLTGAADCWLCLNIVWTWDTDLNSDPGIGHDRSISIVYLQDHNTHNNSGPDSAPLDSGVFCIKNAELKPRGSIWWCKSRQGTLIATARPGLLIWCQLFDAESSVATTGYLELRIWWSSDREIWTSCQLWSISILSCPLEIMIRHYCHYSSLVVQL